MTAPETHDKYFARSIIPLILFYLPIRLYAHMRVRESNH
mgnify:CR=1 FL=1